ncbi:Aste57867_10851 [Aphanomyces stellatus]|uniref:Aste57867_10851 protein n=1 Tax=Aphanomyces stellatus TaxID=120398 RepID=A0A485KRD9_9STRA|nr:hypothetical protein As57867_010811 [Aphanomyces stellatus]VFT87719.1 Aste57867_10851 [Aphanomyces stellatus]
MQRRLSQLVKTLKLDMKTVAILLACPLRRLMDWLSEEADVEDNELELQVQYILWANAMHSKLAAPFKRSSFPPFALLLRQNGGEKSKGQVKPTLPIKARKKKLRGKEQPIIKRESPTDATKYLALGLSALRQQMKALNDTSKTGLPKAIDRGTWSIDCQGHWARIQPRGYCSIGRKNVPAGLELRPANETYLPIRIEVKGLDGVAAFQDTVYWDLYQSDITPQQFAALTSAEMNLHRSTQESIALSIVRQFRQRPSQVPSNAQEHSSLHPIRIHVETNGYLFQDQFEWDISDDCAADPDHFAHVTCLEMNLPPEFESAIAMSIREQVFYYRKMVYSRGTIHGLPLEHDQWSATLKQLGPVPECVDLAYVPRRAEVKAVNVVQKQAPIKYKNIAKIKPSKAFDVFSKARRSAFPRRTQEPRIKALLREAWEVLPKTEKSVFIEMAALETQQRKREHILEQRDKRIRAWEDQEAIRKGLLPWVGPENMGKSRELLVEEYIDARNAVDSRLMEEIRAKDFPATRANAMGTGSWMLM